MSNKLWDKKQQAFRQAIKSLRKEAGMTQAELAKKLKKPQSYISKYENGERRLDYIEVSEICSRCGYTIEEFEAVYETTLKKK